MDELYSAGFVSVAGLAKLAGATYSEAAGAAGKMGAARDQAFLVTASFWGPGGIRCAALEVEDLDAVGAAVRERWGDVPLLGWDLVAVRRRQGARGGSGGSGNLAAAASGGVGSDDPGFSAPALQDSERWGSQAPSSPAAGVLRSPERASPGIPAPPSVEGPALLVLRAAQQECELRASDLASLAPDRDLLARNIEARNKRFAMSTEFVARYPRLLQVPAGARGVESEGSERNAGGETGGLERGPGAAKSAKTATAAKSGTPASAFPPKPAKARTGGADSAAAVDAANAAGVDDLGRYKVETEKEAFIAPDGRISKRLVARPVKTSGSGDRAGVSSNAKRGRTNARDSRGSRGRPDENNSDSSRDDWYAPADDEEYNAGDVFSGVAVPSTDALFGSGSGELSGSGNSGDPGGSTIDLVSPTPAAVPEVKRAPLPSEAKPDTASRKPAGKPAAQVASPVSKKKAERPERPEKAEKGKKGMQGFDITRFLQKK